MGLASSQGRLITLTARKDDVQGQLMKVANKKLSLARQSANVSREYTDALNATKLTYNTGAKDIDVTYGNLMNSTMQCLFTDSAGAVVLNDDYYNKLKAAGLITGNNPSGYMTNSPDNAAKFINAMIGGTTNYTAADIPSISAGSASGNSATNANLSSIPGSYKDSDIFKQLENKSLTDAFMTAQHSDIPGATQIYYREDGTVVSFFAGESGKLRGQTATNLIYLGGRSSTCEGFLVPMLNQIIGDAEGALEKVVNCSSDAFRAAEKAAADATVAFWKGQFYSGGDYAIGKWNSSDGGNTGRYTSASGKDDYIHENSDSGDIYNSKTVALTKGTCNVWDDTSWDHELYLDASQVVKTFLSYFDAACSGIDVSEITKPPQLVIDTRPRNGSSKVSETISYINRTVNVASPGAPPAAPPPENSSGSSKPITANAIYFYNVFNAICNNNGWVKDPNVNNKDYLQGQIKYNNYHIEQYQNGAWTVLSTSDPNSKFNEENDDDAVKIVEAKFHARKDDLDAKEKTLDITQNDLDTERSELVTNMESVKKIVDKEIESLKILDSKG